LQAPTNQIEIKKAYYFFKLAGELGSAEALYYLAFLEDY